MKQYFYVTSLRLLLLFILQQIAPAIKKPMEQIYFGES